MRGQTGPSDLPGGPAGLQGGATVLAAPPLATSLVPPRHRPPPAIRTPSTAATDLTSAVRSPQTLVVLVRRSGWKKQWWKCSLRIILLCGSQLESLTASFICLWNLLTSTVTFLSFFNPCYPVTFHFLLRYHAKVLLLQRRSQR